jgi:hypothetical protein
VSAIIDQNTGISGAAQKDTSNCVNAKDAEDDHDQPGEIPHKRAEILEDGSIL